MKVITQTDDQIPVHIVSIVDARSIQLEEDLAKEHKSKVKSVRKLRSKQIDAGLTVGLDKKSKKNVIPVDMDIDQTDVTGEMLSHFKTIDDNDQEMLHDKENVDVSGRSMFKFQQSVKKSNSTMLKKALIEEDVPAQTLKTSRSTRVTQTKKQERETAISTAPNHSKRRKVQRQLELLKDDRDEEEEQEEYPETSDSEIEEQKQPSEEDEESSDDDDHMRKKKKPMFDQIEGYERYFQDLHTTSKTSDNTLSKLPVLEPQEFHQILQDTPAKHSKEIGILSEMHKQHFPQWFFELHAGFNLVFYGYGSKRNLLNDFAQSSLTDGPMIVVNGFFPSITIKDILLKITAGALGMTAPTGVIQDHVKFICDYFADEDREYESLYIVIHNLDGPNLRNERAQTALSMLAHAENIHLIASVDHINAGLLWDNVKSSRFNWIWHDATTFDDYLVETSFENSLLVRTDELGGARGAKFVLDSLTSNARGVFKILADHQLEEMKNSRMDGRGNESVGLAYGQYYQKCREGFYVSSDLALRTELTEFRDHKLISTRKSLDGTELFFIPLDRATLENIVQQLD
jgi:origin recognition complex subunit 2